MGAGHGEIRSLHLRPPGAAGLWFLIQVSAVGQAQYVGLGSAWVPGLGWEGAELHLCCRPNPRGGNPAVSETFLPKGQKSTKSWCPSESPPATSPSSV